MLDRTLRPLREARGLTQTELAELLGTNASFISLMESGERQPSMQTLARLAEVLGVGFDELLGRTLPAVSDTPNGLR